MKKIRGDVVFGGSTSYVSLPIGFYFALSLTLFSISASGRSKRLGPEHNFPRKHYVRDEKTCVS